ncbi:hypothetical protein [Pelomonas cellulosilytica]|uniref:PLD phosphodiesterase domain-containing protein n=1 Tax=Pelomonas cellulosilytica TaxID=2906762 RepID=A0ABS8XQR3_9BURK|nr:hypothetical protein [Pelomonas sp. P8]MCE4552936.1 hypothetical protein [Pelomonas sp. P8]
MSLEQILEQASTARPGYELAAFREAGLPVYVLTLRVLTLEQKPLGPIDEGVLRAVQAGLSEPEQLVSFLGLSANVLNPVLAGLTTTEQVNYSRAVGEAAAKVTLTAKGRTTLVELSTTRPQERTVRVCFDALTKQLLFISPEQLFKPRELKEMGFVEVPVGQAKRPEVEDISLQEFDRFLQLQRAGLEEKRELLAIRRVERRELHFLGCVMAFYRSQANRNEVDVAFWREDGPALEHENRFRALGGPELVGARLLTTEGTPAAASPQPEPIEGRGQGTPAPATTVITLEAQRAPAAEADDPQTVQSVLCHEHPALLRRALLKSRKRLLIISPWIRHQVVNWEFMASLEALLRANVTVHIGYGLDEGEGAGKGAPGQSKIAITERAEKDLRSLEGKYKNFHLVYVGNTHRKLLVSDDEFAVTTSFNWLSFRGDPKDKPRDEYGEVFRKASQVEKRYQGGLALLQEGYRGAGGAVAARPANAGRKAG